ncbi:MAG: DUF2304 domain-containing protein [Deltaproteobacteria bacterium]|nr:DUF2304 domain-containing protein [Deltaproteobacteria bacterium]
MTRPLLPLGLQLFAIGVLLALLGWVVYLVRRRRLSLRDSLLWLLSTGTALLLMAVPELMRAIARALGVEVPANALFAAAFVYVLLNLLSLTMAVSSWAERTRRLAQECALLRAEIAQLRALGKPETQEQERRRAERIC